MLPLREAGAAAPGVGVPASAAGVGAPGDGVSVARGQRSRSPRAAPPHGGDRDPVASRQGLRSPRTGCRRAVETSAPQAPEKPRSMVTPPPPPPSSQSQSQSQSQPPLKTVRLVLPQTWPRLLTTGLATLTPPSPLPRPPRTPPPPPPPPHSPSVPDLPTGRERPQPRSEHDWHRRPARLAPGPSTAGAPGDHNCLPRKARPARPALPASTTAVRAKPNYHYRPRRPQLPPEASTTDAPAGAQAPETRTTT